MSPIAITLILLLVAVVLFATEKIPVDIVGILLVIGLVMTGILTVNEGLSGFGDNIIITIAGLFVLTGGLVKTGYNNGPHVGTISFEVGNQNLKRERSNGIDFGLRHSSNRFRFDASAYYYRLKDFVYFAFADLDGDGIVDREDGLPLSFYSQGDSRYIGAEVNFDADVNKYVNFFFTADLVRAKLTSEDLNLPRIPPSRARIGVDLKYKNLSVRPEGVFASEQNRLYPLETRTAGYGLFNVAASYIIGRDHYAHIFGVNAYNLFDKEYRNHLSFIKDLAPEIGRGVRFNYTIRFF